jgi:putative flavoprotein involved in K+ transport
MKNSQIMPSAVTVALSTTGTWSRPFLPVTPGREVFTGRQLHTVNYRSPTDFAGQRVIVVDVATARRRALEEGRSDIGGVASLGDIVAVPPVRSARDTGLLSVRPMFTRLTADGVRWDDGSHSGADAVV